MRDTYKKALRDGAKETIKGLLRQPVTPEGYPGRMAEIARREAEWNTAVDATMWATDGTWIGGEGSDTESRLVVLYSEEEANREKSRRTDPASGDYADLHDEWLMIQWEIQDLEDETVEEEFFA